MEEALLRASFSNVFLYRTGANAPGARHYFLRFAIFKYIDPLKVGHPSPEGNVVRMADFVPDFRPLAANFTFS